MLVAELLSDLLKGSSASGCGFGQVADGHGRDDRQAVSQGHFRELKQLLKIGWDERSGIAWFPEFGVEQAALQEELVSLDADTGRVCHDLAHLLDGQCSSGSPDDDLCNHRVKVDRDVGSGLDGCLVANIPTWS